MDSSQNDRDLLFLFRQPESRNHAFGLLLDKYSRKIYWHVRRIVIDHDDADDVVQNTFIKVWEKLNDFREESAFYTWLYRVANNEALSFLNKKKSDRHISIEDLQEEMGQQLVSGSYFNGDRTELLLQQAVLKLPEKQRLVFNMKYNENLKYEEMEAILGTSVGALKASYHHAVKKIEEFVRTSLNQ